MPQSTFNIEIKFARIMKYDTARRTTFFLWMLCFLFPFTGYAQHEMNLGIISGMSFSSISNSYYKSPTSRQTNSFTGVELEYGLNKLQALSVGLSFAERGSSFTGATEINYSYLDIPIAFVHHLPLDNLWRLSFRAGVTPSFLNRDDKNAPSKKALFLATVGAGISYEFLYNWRISLRGEYGHALSSQFDADNSYFRKEGKMSEGRVSIGISCNLNPDPLRKKLNKIPECLK